MNLDDERLKTVLTTQTYGKLKDFSRFNGLKLCKVLDTFAYLLMHDEELRNKVIALTLEDKNRP
jgi:hypothetical protein